MEPVLVVDFGTTTSSAIVVDDDGERLVREPGSDRDWWPSAVCLDEDGQLLVGSLAEQGRRVDPRTFRTEFKPDLDDDAPIPLGAKSYRPSELVGEVLTAILDEATEGYSTVIERVALTVPASYRPGDPRPALMIGAAEAAGVRDVELLAEPVAAAFAPLRGAPLAAGEIVLVYDLGGGTFDAALIEVAAGGAQRVIGSDALDDCGGRDVDAILHRWVRGHGGDALAALLRGDDAGPIRADLDGLVRQLKHRLSDAATARDRLYAAGLRVDLTRAEFTAMVRPLIDRTIECCTGLLARHDEAPTSVLLVGGSCRMPVVAEAVSAAFGLPVRHPRDASTAVVHGAAAWAARAAERRSPAREPSPEERPLRWELPGGTGTLSRWCLEPGSNYVAGGDLALVRLGDGALWRLAAPDDGPGRLTAVHVDLGATVTSGDWLATVGAPATGPVTATGWTGAPVTALTFLGPDHLVVATDAGSAIHRLDGTVLETLTSGPTPLAGTTAGGAVVWAVGREVLVKDAPTAATERAHVMAGPVVQLAIGDRGRTVVTTGAHSRVATGVLRRSSESAVWTLRRQGSALHTVFAVANSGVSFAVASLTHWEVRDIESGELGASVALGLADVRTMAYVLRDRAVAVTNSWGEVVVREAVTGDPLASWREARVPHALACGPDGCSIAVALDSGVMIRDATDGTVLHGLPSASPVRAVAFSPDGTQLAQGCADGRVMLHRLS